MSEYFTNVLKGIKEYVDENSVVYSYIVGCKSWGGNSVKDTDVVVVVKDVQFHKGIYIEDLKTDVFVYGEDFFREMATANNKGWYYSPYIGLAMAFPENVLYGEMPIENYNWFDYQYKALKQLYVEGGKYYFNSALCNRIAKGNCIKGMVLGLLAYYAIQNQSFEFTDEQKEILQKCHDLQLPASYAEELKTNMEKILKAQGLI